MQDSKNENTLPGNAHPSDASRSSGRSQQPSGETMPVHPSKEPSTAVSTGSSLPADATVALRAAQPATSKPEKEGKRRRWPILVFGVFLIALFGFSGGYMGYRSAIQLRQAKQAEAMVTRATEFFMLGYQAQQNKQYSLAEQYYKQAIQLDPKFPGAAEKLTEVLMSQMATATPTIQPTPTVPTLTPTKDIRTQEEIFNQAKQQYADKEWDALFSSINSLRSVDPHYRAVDVNGMLYMALRFRGIRKIYQEANLEGGIYDLALAGNDCPAGFRCDGSAQRCPPVSQCGCFLGCRLGAGNYGL